MNARTREPLGALVEAVRQLEGLTEQVGTFALPADTVDAAPELVRATCRSLDVPLTFELPAPPDFAVAALAVEIRRAQASPGLAGLGTDDVTALAAEARLLRDIEDAPLRRLELRRPDGTVVTAVDAGPQDADCVVISPACAMSYRLSRPWLEVLRRSYRCVVPQTRGTSGPLGEPAAFDARGTGVPEQADDLSALITALGAGPVHLMGLCGGAVPALVVGARRPDQVRSLSLWHADLELGDEADKTDHQQNLRALLDLAGESRETAAWLRDRLTVGPLTGVPPVVGPLVVRPYATAELFHRYAKLTAATMHWDSRDTAHAVRQPCLVVTSHDDHTAHPAGSRRLAELLPDARLMLTDHGTHLDAFNATAEQVAQLTAFLGPGRPRFQ